jgi:hypothetical protein
MSKKSTPWPKGAYSEAKIRARWMWDRGYVRATRANILLALRRTRSPYGLSFNALPYVQPVVGMRVQTYRGELGTIVQVRKPMSRGGDPEVKIEISPQRSVYLFQTAVCGYRKAPAEAGTPNGEGEA